MNSIPKVIHYCWFGGKPLPKLAEKCIDSWKNFFPDYEIKRWDESNFDVNIIPYTSQAYKAKKFAFVSDYARFWILYHYGGIYFDTDVEVIRPMNDIILAGSFMGCERPTENMKASGMQVSVAPGLGLGALPGLDLYKELLNIYEKLNFINPDGSTNLKTIVSYTTELLYNKGLRNKHDNQSIEGITIYPPDFFCPKDITTGKLILTKNTRTIHHYDGSWIPAGKKLKQKIISLLGYNVTHIIVNIKHFIFRSKYKRH